MAGRLSTEEHVGWNPESPVLCVCDDQRRRRDHIIGSGRGEPSRASESTPETHVIVIR